MLTQKEYELLDFGEGRRLERFNDLVLDRPCPTAIGIRKNAPSLWNNADAVFVETRSSTADSKSALGFRGNWKSRTDRGARFLAEKSENNDSDDESRRVCETVSVAGRFVLELKGSPFGHIGIFPEQSENWRTIFEFTSSLKLKSGESPRVLNLFGYTGGSALAAIAGGAETTHLDAARNIVAQAKRNAFLSFGDCEEEQVGAFRWIVDDAAKFVKREVKRESRYDGIILDPPSYGHGARGEVWRLSRDLPTLLLNCATLLKGSGSFVVLSAHTPGFDAKRLERELRDALLERGLQARYLTRPMALRTKTGRVLPSGEVVIATIR